MYSLIWLLSSDDAHEKTMCHVPFPFSVGSQNKHLEQIGMQSHFILAEF